MIVVWDINQQEPWVVMTDLPPAQAGVCWYALRFWIELGFKAIKSVGWQWQKTRRTDPQRVSRHWLVLSVATLLALAYGTRVEDAFDLGKAPGRLRAPPKLVSPHHRSAASRPRRIVSVLRQGIIWLSRLLGVTLRQAQGRLSILSRRGMRRKSPSRERGRVRPGWIPRLIRRPG